MKSVLDSVKSLTQFSQDRFSDRELGRFIHQRMTQELGTADLLLSGLLNYFRVTTPIRKVNTVNALIEEVLKKNKAQLEEKKAQLFKRVEENLPEIIVPDEQLRYILDFVLQYIILSTPPNGTIDFLATSFIFLPNTGGTQVFFDRYGGYIEISVAFSSDPAAAWGRIPATQKDEALEFMLRLVKGMVLKNWGKMNFETDKKKGKTILSLRFPLERRRVVSYEPIRMNLSASHPKF